MKHVTQRNGLLFPRLRSWVHTVVLWHCLYLLTLAGRPDTADSFCFMVTWLANSLFPLGMKQHWHHAADMRRRWGLLTAAWSLQGSPWLFMRSFIPLYPTFRLFLSWFWPSESVFQFCVRGHMYIGDTLFPLSWSGSINILIINGSDCTPCVRLWNTFLKAYLRGLRWV